MNAPANIDHSALSSIDLEQEILGAVLVSNSALEIIEREVSAEDFSEPLHGQLFETLASVRDAHGIITPVVCTENFIRVDGAPKSPKLAE